MRAKTKSSIFDSSPTKCTGLHKKSSTVPRRLLTLMLVSMLASFSTWAQSVTMVVQPVRVTVPVNFSGTTIVSNVVVTVRTNGATMLDGTGTNWLIDPINMSVSGVPSLPPGLSFSITDTNGVPVSSFPVALSTDEASTSINLLLWVNSTNVSEGIYTFSLDASGGATRSLFLSFQAAHIWSGGTYTNGGTADFSDSGNWVGGDVPENTSDVVLYNEGGAVGSGDETTNILISMDTEIGSLRQAITSGARASETLTFNRRPA